MAGCLALKYPCAIPEPDPLTPEERENIEVVRSFIDRVWNHRWTPEESRECLAQIEQGDPSYVPRAIATALEELRSDTTVRHRRDSVGALIRSSGPADYRTCINAVHQLVRDLSITIVDLACGKDHVVAQVRITGIDRRLDGKTDEAGAFGALPPTGRPFEAQTSTLYRICDRQIAEDWLLSKA